jgi:hypothetical protein
MSHILVQWTALEYPKKERRTDWFWAVGIIAISGAVSAILSHNTLFGILILLATGTLLFYSRREPREMYCKITPTKIVVGGTAYPFETIKHFWIDERGRTTLLIHVDKLLLSTVAIPIVGVETTVIREILLKHLSESELRASPFESLLEYLGF